MWPLGMTVHKLNFFRFPYRWAAYGDHPGLYGSDPASRRPTKTTTAKIMTWIGWSEKCHRFPGSKVLRD